MPSIAERLEQLWTSIKVSKSRTRACFALTDPDAIPFQKNQHYFQVLINEMYLTDSRQWFVEYDPVAIVAATYKYGSEYQTTPSVVGPVLLKQYSDAVAQGAIIRNAPVTSLNAYTGGPITLTIFLNAVKRANNAEKVLSVLENITGAVSPVAPVLPLQSYLKIAGNIMDSVKTLLGLDDTEALISYRFTVNPDINQVFAPSHIVLIDMDEDEARGKHFWVKEGRLVEGAEGNAYREHNFVLLQIAQGVQRSDEETLPFYSLWRRTQEIANGATSDSAWADAKAHFNTLKRALLESPDLTRPDFERLVNAYLATTVELRRQAILLASLSGPSTDGEPLSAEEEQRLADERQLQALAKALDKLDEP